MLKLVPFDVNMTFNQQFFKLLRLFVFFQLFKVAFYVISIHFKPIAIHTVVSQQRSESSSSGECQLRQWSTVSQKKCILFAVR
jgi:hypothetical protein